MIQIGNIQANGNDSSNNTYTCSFQQMLVILLLDTFNEIGNNHRSNDEQIIISHLHMVGFDLKGTKDGSHRKSPQVFPSISQHDTCYHWRQIGQGHHFPDMTCSNDDEEIAAECPYHRAQHGQIPTEIKGTQQDVEAQQIGKHIPHILWQPQVIGINTLRQHISTVIRWSHLIGRHTSKQGIRPSCYLTSLLIILMSLLTSTPICRRVVTIENASFYVCREEIGKRYSYKYDHYQHLG